jgi:hypothetical protein
MPIRENVKFKKWPVSIFSNEYLEKHKDDGLSDQIYAVQMSQQHSRLMTGSIETIPNGSVVAEEPVKNSSRRQKGGVNVSIFHSDVDI